MIALSTTDEIAAQRTGIVGRWWFAGIGVVYVVVSILGFAPQSLTNAQRGIIRPVELHIHAAIMGLFLLVFVTQALLAGRGAIVTHRRLGAFAAVLGTAAYLSMLVVLDSAMRRENPYELPFLVPVLTLGMLQSTAFLALLAAAVLMRNRPAWHRRLMAFAVLITLPAALQRMSWLPPLPLPSFWGSGAWLYVLAVPLIAFDLTTLRRLHGATLSGLAVVTLFVGVLAVVWDSASYRSGFLETWRSLYGS